MEMQWIEYALQIVSGLVVLVPLVLKLIEYVKKATKEKNWNKLLELTMNLMQEAETKFTDGASKKQWVLAMVKASADTINYDIDMEEVSKMIDSLCAMTKVVNPPIEQNTENEPEQESK